MNFEKINEHNINNAYSILLKNQNQKSEIKALSMSNNYGQKLLCLLFNTSKDSKYEIEKNINKVKQNTRDLPITCNMYSSTYEKDIEYKYQNIDLDPKLPLNTSLAHHNKSEVLSKLAFAEVKTKKSKTGTYYGLSINIGCLTPSDILTLISRLEKLFDEKLKDTVNPIIIKNKIFRDYTIEDKQFDSILNKFIQQASQNKTNIDKNKLIKDTIEECKQQINLVKGVHNIILNYKLAAFLLTQKMPTDAYNILNKIKSPKQDFFDSNDDGAYQAAMLLKAKIFCNALNHMKEDAVVKQIKKNIYGFSSIGDPEIIHFLFEKLANPSRKVEFKNTNSDPENAIFNAIFSVTDDSRNLRKEIKKLETENKNHKLEIKKLKLELNSKNKDKVVISKKESLKDIDKNKKKLGME